MTALKKYSLLSLTIITLPVWLLVVIVLCFAAMLTCAFDDWFSNAEETFACAEAADHTP